MPAAAEREASARSGSAPGLPAVSGSGFVVAMVSLLCVFSIPWGFRFPGFLRGGQGPGGPGGMFGDQRVRYRIQGIMLRVQGVVLADAVDGREEDGRFQRRTFRTGRAEMRLQGPEN